MGARNYRHDRVSCFCCSYIAAVTLHFFACSILCRSRRIVSSVNLCRYVIAVNQKLFVKRLLNVSSFSLHTTDVYRAILCLGASPRRRSFNYINKINWSVFDACSRRVTCVRACVCRYWWLSFRKIACFPLEQNLPVMFRTLATLPPADTNS